MFLTKSNCNPIFFSSSHEKNQRLIETIGLKENRRLRCGVSL